MHRHQKKPYSRPTPTQGQALGGKGAMNNFKPYQASGNRERRAPVQPYSNYAPNSPQTLQPGSYQPYSQQEQHRPAMATYSAQAMRTFAPEQQFTAAAGTPDAALVPIRSLQPERAFVCVSGRTVRAPEIKAFPNKWNSSKQTWLMSFIIKDDSDTIDVKFWHKTQEHLSRYTHITVVHIITDEVKMNTKPYGCNKSSYIPSTSSMFHLSLSEGKVGHRIEVGNEHENDTMFKVALGANLGGVIQCVSIKQVFNSLSSIGSQRFNLVVCIKKLVSSGVINSKNGPLVKTCFTVFDIQGQEASLTMWGEIMGEISHHWIPQTTTLIISGAQASMYLNKPQITIGYQSHIQVDPVCKNVEWLKHFASQNMTAQDAVVDVEDGVRIDHIQTSYHIVDIPKLIDSMGPLEVNYGYTFAILCELDIDTTASDLLTAKCPMCNSAINSFTIDLCPTCNIAPTGDNMWHFNFARYMSFMDDTAELRHPSISSEVVENFLGFKPDQFSSLTLVERAQLKKRFYLERYKIHFKISWSENKKKHIVQIIAMSQALLSEISQFNKKGKHL
ncbi:hypothetical protein BGZ95_003431 [Linnemannia exigua]|uniref:MEIOB-like N-terminal domain-containing protein n=1 Tax=Linnemannia exigua TaxID=604196 RepID=A0AAD4H2E0_9FUNG|nr:hypothetical protein BGZ95_003431 [Linnemannia exigua]